MLTAHIVLKGPKAQPVAATAVQVAVQTAVAEAGPIKGFGGKSAGFGGKTKKTPPPKGRGKVKGAVGRDEAGVERLGRSTQTHSCSLWCDG